MTSVKTGSKFTLFNLPLPIFIIITVLVLIAAYIGVLPLGMTGCFIFMIVVGAWLDLIGNKAPIIRSYFGGGAIVILFGVALLHYFHLLPELVTDEGKQRQAALLAFSAFPELKHVILVDEDVDIFDSSDVLWAMNTRFQGDADIITIPGVRCHPLDPSASPSYTGSISDVGISTQTIFDCTVPFHLKDRFRRAAFLEVDPQKWLGEV